MPGGVVVAPRPPVLGGGGWGGGPLSTNSDSRRAPRRASDDARRPLPAGGERRKEGCALGDGHAAFNLFIPAFAGWAPSPRSSRGEGCGEGLSPQIRTRASPPHPPHL